MEEKVYSVGVNICFKLNLALDAIHEDEAASVAEEIAETIAAEMCSTAEYEYPRCLPSFTVHVVSAEEKDNA